MFNFVIGMSIGFTSGIIITFIVMMVIATIMNREN